MRKASILLQPVETIEIGKISYEVEQSLNRNITQKDTLEKLDNKLPFSQEVKKTESEN